MADGRKNNGNKGHSTRSTKANDKRKNSARAMLEQYLKEEFDYDKFKALMNKQLKFAMDGDTKAATLFLNYMLGKPKETVQVAGQVTIPVAKWIDSSQDGSTEQ